MRLRSLAVLFLALVAGLALAGRSVRGDDAAPASSPASRLSLPGLSIDVDRREVVIPAKVALRQGNLEFLLCKEGTKDYESVLATRTPPSNIHAALLALGLSPGRSGHWVKQADGSPHFVAPSGAAVDITVRWHGPDRAIEVPAWKLLKPNHASRPAGPIRWVFVGSQLTDEGAYLADAEGTLISVANFGSSVLDVPFVSTDQNAALEFSSNTDLLPPQGAEVEVVLTADKQAASAPDARMFISVDRLGRIELDGKRVSLPELEEEARRFLAAHSQALAEVRIDSQAMVYDQQRVQEALRQAGVEEVHFRVVGAAAELPRTPEEAEQDLAEWREQLTSGEDLMRDPAEEARGLLAAMQRRQQELCALGDLWQGYARSLQTMIRNRPTSQPVPASQPATRSAGNSAAATDEGGGALQPSSRAGQ